MPQSETLNTDDTSIYTFTATITVAGTPPYTYDWSVSPKVPFVVSGASGEIVTFNAIDLVGGEYPVQVTCVVTDALGDRVVLRESYDLTVNPFSADFSVAGAGGESFTLTVGATSALPPPYGYELGVGGAINPDPANIFGGRIVAIGDYGAGIGIEMFITSSPPVTIPLTFFDTLTLNHSGGSLVLDTSGDLDLISSYASSGESYWWWPDPPSGAGIWTGLDVGQQYTISFAGGSLGGSEISLDQGSMANSATGPVSVSVGNYSGGQAPYTLTARWGGGQPHPTIGFVVTSNTTVEITTTDTPAGSYSGYIEIVAADNLGQAITYIVPVSLTVPAPQYSVDAGLLLEYEIGETPDVQSNTVTISAVSGAPAPIVYSGHRFENPNTTKTKILTAAGGSQVTLESDSTNLNDGTFNNDVLVTATDATGQSVEIRIDGVLNISPAVVVPPPPSYSELFDTVLTSLDAVLSYNFQEASGNLINQGSLGASFDMIPVAGSDGLTYQAGTGLPALGTYIEWDDSASVQSGFYQPGDLTDGGGSTIFAATGAVVVVAQLNNPVTSQPTVLSFRRSAGEREYITYDSGATGGDAQMNINAGIDASVTTQDSDGSEDNNTGLQDGRFHLLVVTQRGDARNLTAYIDGRPYVGALGGGTGVNNWLQDYVMDVGMTIGGACGTATTINGDRWDGGIQRLAILNTPPNNREIFDLARNAFGDDFTTADAYEIYTRYFYPELSANRLWQRVENVRHGAYWVANWKGVTDKFVFKHNGPAGDPPNMAYSGTSNPAPGMVAIADPGGRADHACRFTGQWQYGSVATYVEERIWGLTKGSFMIWFRRPNGNAATAFVNALLCYGTPSLNTAERGIQLSFRDASQANDPDSLCLMWNEDLSGYANSAGSVIAAPNDTDWHMFAATCDGLTDPKIYLDGVLQSPTTFENGTALLTNWGDAVTAGFSVRLGTGNGSVCRTYADIFGLQSFPEVVLTGTNIKDFYDIMVGNLTLDDARDLIPIA